tara:strand:+ start:214 stop:858 length:645 start_codon:yes stop_codon:yes gene_type:complete
MSSDKINESNDSGSLNKKILKELRLTSQEHMLFNCMDQFYNNKENTDNAVKLINFLDGEISIRLIDFFVTNYASKNRISYKIQLNDNTTVFNVHSSYKSQLKAWKKIHFDPFSRGTRIPFFLNDNKDCLITTIGQLNFFKWFITNQLSTFIKSNIDKIENEMNKNKKTTKKNKTKKSKPVKKYNKDKNYKQYNMTPTLACDVSKKKTKIEVRFD